MDRLPPELLEAILRPLQTTALQPYSSNLFRCVSLSKSISPVALLLLYRSIFLHDDRRAAELALAAPAFGSDEYPTIELSIYGDLYEGLRNETFARVLGKCRTITNLTVQGFVSLDSRFLQSPNLKNLKRLVLDTRCAEHAGPLNVHFALHHLVLAPTPIPPSLLTAIYDALDDDGLRSLQLSSLFDLDIIDRFLLRSVTPKLRKLFIDVRSRPDYAFTQLRLIASHCPNLVELRIGPHEFPDRTVELAGHETTLRILSLRFIGWPLVGDIAAIEVVLQTPFFRDLRSLTIRVPDSPAGAKMNIVTPYWRTRLAEMETREAAVDSVDV